MELSSHLPPLCPPLPSLLMAAHPGLSETSSSRRPSLLTLLPHSGCCPSLSSSSPPSICDLRSAICVPPLTLACHLLLSGTCGVYLPLLCKLRSSPRGRQPGSRTPACLETSCVAQAGRVPAPISVLLKHRLLSFKRGRPGAPGRLSLLSDS